MSRPRNTAAEAAANPAGVILEALVSGNPGGPPAAIHAMEARGQQEVVTGEALPTKVSDADRGLMIEWGFAFGQPYADDPLFRPVTLPPGWRKEAADDHDMWSYVLDTKGRKRVAVFYKAAYYDRRADMRLESRYYVESKGQEGKIFEAIDRQTGEILFTAEGGYNDAWKLAEDFIKGHVGTLDFHDPRHWTE